LTREQISNELNITGNTVAWWERDEMKIPPFLHLLLETIERKSSVTKIKKD
jgi:transcriptional regulator with XRE-family HTH domain